MHAKGPACSTFIGAVPVALSSQREHYECAEAMDLGDERPWADDGPGHVVGGHDIGQDGAALGGEG